MCKYLDGQTNVVSLKDTNYNMKNLRYQLVGGSSITVLGKEVVDPFLLKIAGITTELWKIDDYASDLIVLRLASTRILTKICMLEEENDNIGSLAVLCLSLFMRLRLYAINTTETNFLERMNYMWASLLWFTSFDHQCGPTMMTNKRNIVMEIYGMMFLLPRNDLTYPRHLTSEPCEHFFGSYRCICMEFTVLQLTELE